MTDKFKPMLAATVEDVSKLTFPLMASPKLDGIRAVVRNGVVLSRSLKPIPNIEVQKKFARPWFDGLDGELIVGSPTDKDVFRKTTSVVMSKDAPANDVSFFVFDQTDCPESPFEDRFNGLFDDPFDAPSGFRIVTHDTVHNVAGLEAYETQVLEAGYEGVMLRSPEGLYKHGRGTLRAQDLMSSSGSRTPRPRCSRS